MDRHSTGRPRPAIFLDDALLAFHSDPLDRDMRAVLWWCDCLGVTWRAVRLEAEARPT